MARACLQRDLPGAYEYLRGGPDCANLGRARAPAGAVECDRPHAAHNRRQLARSAPVGVRFSACVTPRRYNGHPNGEGFRLAARIALFRYP